MKHSEQKPGGPGTPTPLAGCILKLCSMQTWWYEAKRAEARGPGTPTPQAERILKLCSMQRNISVMIWSTADRSHAWGSGTPTSQAECILNYALCKGIYPWWYEHNPGSPGTPTPQAGGILKLCSVQRNILYSRWYEAQRAETRGSRYPYPPSRMHPKIMLYAEECILDDMKHSGQKPGGPAPGTPTPQAGCILKLCSMHRTGIYCIRDDMKHSGQKPGGPGTPTPQAECILKLFSMQKNISVMIWSKSGRNHGVQVPLHPK